MKGGHWNGDEWRWHRWSDPAEGPQSIVVWDLSDDAQCDREARIRAGARVVPFGFSRALEPKPETVEPLLWEGDYA